MVRYYVGLDEEQARQIEEMKAKYEAELNTSIPSSKFIRKLIFSGLEAVVYGGNSRKVNRAAT